MTPKEVGESYGRIAAQWDSPPFDRSNGLNALKKAISFCEDLGWTLDIGCGCSGRSIELRNSLCLRDKKILEGNGCICRHKEFDQAPEKHFYLVAQKISKC